MPNKRMSLNQLSEYLTAGPQRRKTIISEASDTKPFIARTYNDASSAISKDILSPQPEHGQIVDAISALKHKINTSIPDWQKQHVKLCIEALEKYLQIKPSINLGAWKVISPNVGPGSISIAGLRVNVSPEAVLVREKGNEINVGAVKLYFSKSKKLGKKRADYIGALLHWYAEKHLASQGTADYASSLIINVPDGLTHIAPKAKVRNRGDIEAACEEIVGRWPS